MQGDLGGEGHPSYIFPLSLKSEKQKVPVFAISLYMVSIITLSNYWLLESEGLAGGAGGYGRGRQSCGNF